MRRPNYTVFIYDASGRYVDRFKVWAASSIAAISKAKRHMEERHRKIEMLSFVARFEDEGKIKCS